MENRFSVIIPCYNKADKIGSCLQSLISQTYGNFEAIIIDDGSTDKSREVIKTFLKDGRFRAYFLPDNSGRLVARNTGMRMARNNWICWLDADDEYMTNYFEVYNDEINRNPDYKIFNTGMLIKEREMVGEKRYEKGWRIIEPLELKEEGEGMESFNNGRIGSGSFVFHNSLMEYFPEDVKTPCGGDDSLPARWVERDPMMLEICKRNDDAQWLPLGNPWGDDYSYFFKLTRKNKSKKINCLLYIQHVRK